MAEAQVITFMESPGRTMTCEEGLTFIERMRRQLDRFGVAVPGKNGQQMDPEIEERIRQICDELEAELKIDLGFI